MPSPNITLKFFFRFRITDIFSFLTRDCPEHGRKFSNPLGLYVLGACTKCLPVCDSQKHIQTLPSVLPRENCLQVTATT